MVFSCFAFAQKQENYSRVKVYLDENGHNLKALSALGVAADHGEYKNTSIDRNKAMKVSNGLVWNINDRTAQITSAKAPLHFERLYL